MAWKHRSRSSRRVPIAVALAALLASMVPAPLPTVAAPSDCPPAYPLHRVRAGKMVEGLTVETGRRPDPFTAEIIGVIENGIFPGVDMIVAEASSPAIDRAGGIWAGMSGSPVYAADGRLIGAVAYGLTFESSPIAGITPASEMYRLLDRRGTVAPADTVDLPERLEDDIVASGAATRSEVSRGLSMLSMPVGISGLGPIRQDQRKVTRRITERIPNASVYSASSASGSASSKPLVAGGNVAAALSYGDVSAAGVGTVTAVCGDEALLFGHPFSFAGRTSLSAHHAQALFVQPGLLGAFKVANLGKLVGTVDQDRLAGLHTSVGEVPTTASVRSTLTGTESGRSRTSATRVVEPSFTPTAALYHTLFNLDRVADRYGEGGVEFKWSASGTRADGSPWRLARRELVASEYDASFEAAFTLYDPLTSVLENQFEEVTLDSVRVNGEITPKFVSGRIVGLQQLGGKGRWRTVSPRERLSLVAGTDAQLRAIVDEHRSTRTRTVQLTVRVPRAKGARGELVISGGGGGFFSFDEDFFGEGPSAGSFDGLLADIKSAPAGDTVTATLFVDDDDRLIERTSRATARSAVRGSVFARVQVVARPR